MGLLAGPFMSQFTPTQWTLEPNTRPDHLSSAILHSLSRRVLGLTWGPLKTLVLGGISFGILPLIVWPRKFARFIAFERQQLWHLVEWLRIRTGEDETAALRDSVRSTGAIPTLWIVPVIMFIILGVNFIPWLNTPGFNLHALLFGTYFFDSSTSMPLPFHHWGRYFQPAHMPFYRVWTLCLSIAYASHWLHVQQHVSDVHRVVRRMNLIFARQHVPPVGLIGPGIGFRPLWMLAALFGVVCGAWWAIPAAFAGAVHQRYIERSSTRIRAELAQRVGTMLQQQRPFVDVPTPHGLRVVCSNPLCEKSAPPGATFCPRCGAPIASQFEAVA
jgi:hypothetical protein